MKPDYIKAFLIEHAPDFCWCTAHDLFLMCEQIHENVDYYCFTSAFSHHRKALFYQRLARKDQYWNKTGRPGREYLRKPMHLILGRDNLRGLNQNPVRKAGHDLKAIRTAK